MFRVSQKRLLLQLNGLVGIAIIIDLRQQISIPAMPTLQEELFIV